MLSVKLLDDSGVAYRTAGFLGLPQVGPGAPQQEGLPPRSTPCPAAPTLTSAAPSDPALLQIPPAVRHGVHPVVIAAERPPADALPALGHAATVWPGIKQGELLQAVAPYSHSPVLHLRWVGLASAGLATGVRLPACVRSGAAGTALCCP